VRIDRIANLTDKKCTSGAKELLNRRTQRSTQNPRPDDLKRPNTMLADGRMHCIGSEIEITWPRNSTEINANLREERWFGK
jgi:hypothetical protein